jgi:hypothetical protein
MITKTGTVTITADEIRVEHFHFEGGTFSGGGEEAIAWARNRLLEESLQNPLVDAFDNHSTRNITYNSEA